MRVFCYKCRECGATYDHTALLADGNTCDLECGGKIVRDYKREAVGIDTAMLRDARG